MTTYGAGTLLRSCHVCAATLLQNRQSSKEHILCLMVFKVLLLHASRLENPNFI